MQKRSGIGTSKLVEMKRSTFKPTAEQQHRDQGFHPPQALTRHLARSADKAELGRNRYGFRWRVPEPIQPHDH